MRKVYEILIFNNDGKSNFEEFLDMLIERLKALRYCKRLVVTIERSLNTCEVRVTLITPKNTSREIGEY